MATAGDALLSWILSECEVRARENDETNASVELMERDVVSLLARVDALCDAVPSRRLAKALRDTHRARLRLVDARAKARQAKGEALTLADITDAIVEGAVERVRPKMMTVVAIMAGLLPIMWSTGAGSEVMRRIAAPMVGGVPSEAFGVKLLTSTRNVTGYRGVKRKGGGYILAENVEAGTFATAVEAAVAYAKGRAERRAAVPAPRRPQPRAFEHLPQRRPSRRHSLRDRALYLIVPHLGEPSDARAREGVVAEHRIPARAHVVERPHRREFHARIRADERFEGDAALAREF